MADLEPEILAPELVVILLEGRSNQSTLPCHDGPFLCRGLACANASDQFPELNGHGEHDLKR